MRKTLGLVTIALLAVATASRADKKDDELADIQRDVAQVGEQVRDLQKAQAAQAKQIEELQGMLQQAASASTQTQQDMATLKTALTNLLSSSMAEQQDKLSKSITVSLGSRMDGLATSVDQLNTTFSAMSDRIGKVETKVGELKDAVNAINAPPPTPPPAVIVPDTNTGNNVPPGVNKAGLWEDAQRDYTSNNNEMALKEFSDYVRYWPMDSQAPDASYLIGQIYMRGKDYESAVQAFQAVIDNYPGHNRSQDALFQKGRAYELWMGHRKDAIDTLQQFVDKYPVNDNVPVAKEALKKLKNPAGGRGRGGPNK